jgi:hypothetical protein
MTALLGLSDFEEEEITFLRNVSNDLPIHTAQHPRRLDSLRLKSLEEKRAKRLCGIFKILPRTVP